MYRFSSYEERQQENERKHREYLQRQEEKERKHREYLERTAEKERRHQITALYKEGTDFLGQGRLQDALFRFNSVLQSNPNYTSAYLKRAIVYTKLEKHQEALNDLLAAQYHATHDPMFKSHAELQSRLGSAYFKLGQFQEAIHSCQQAQNGEQGEPDFYNLLTLCQAHLSLGDYNQAKIQFNCILQHPFPYKFSNIKFLLPSYKKLIEMLPPSTQKTELMAHKEWLLRLTERLRTKSSELDDELLSITQKLDVCYLTQHQPSVSGAINTPPAENIRRPRSEEPEKLSFYDEGEYHFKKTILPWSKEEIFQKVPLTPMQPSYRSVEDYFNAYIPLILEECRTILRAGLNNIESAPSFRLHEFNFIRPQNLDNPSKITCNVRFPKNFTEDSKTNLAVWMQIYHNGNLVHECLGLMNCVTEIAEIKILSTDKRLYDFIERNRCNITLFYLGSLVSHERMFTVCFEKPQSELIRQISEGRLIPSVTPPNVSILQGNLDPSQHEAVRRFTLSKENTITLLQGPPGTGKTTTIVALLKKCVARHERLIVCAPSNKAVQVLATRALTEMPNTKLVMAGVEDKMPEHLLDIFVHAWYLKRIALRLQEIFLEAFPNDPKHFSENFLIADKTTIEQNQQKTFEQIKKITDLLTKYNLPLEPLAPVIRIISGLYGLMLNLTSEQKKSFLDMLERKEADDALKKEQAPPDPITTYASTREQLVLQLNKLIAMASNPELERTMLESADILFATMSVLGRKSFDALRVGFDALIIDEAGQAVEAEALIPFHFPIKKCLLVGDTNQLPATTFADTAQTTHFNWSILWRLVEENRQPFHMLNTQYRMDAAIRSWPSRRFYENKLEDASTIVTRGRLVKRESNAWWQPCQFVNVQTGTEKNSENSFFNENEARLIVQFIRTLQKTNEIDLSKSIGVITFYSAQVEYIKSLLAGIRDIPPIRVNTVDGFQGEENDIILISFVRSNLRGNVGFLNDFRRLNVAVTRARYHLLMFGNEATLRSSDQDDLQDLLLDLQKRQLVISEMDFEQNISLASDLPEQLSKEQKKICFEFRDKGHCKFGDKCYFEHSSSRFSQRLTVASQPPESIIAPRTEMGAAEAAPAARPLDKPSVTLSKEKVPENYKTQLCFFWSKNHSCRDGDRCNYAHGQEELRTTSRRIY